MSSVEIESCVPVVEVFCFSYVPNRSSTKSRITMKWRHTLKSDDLKKHQDCKQILINNFKKTDLKYLKWFTAVLTSEFNFVTNRSRIDVIQWNIETDSLNVFQYNKEQFESVTIIHSPEIEYWYYENFIPFNSCIKGSKMKDVNSKPNIIERRNRLLRPEPNPDVYQIIKARCQQNLVEKSFPNLFYTGNCYCSACHCLLVVIQHHKCYNLKYDITYKKESIMDCSEKNNRTVKTLLETISEDE